MPDPISYYYRQPQSALGQGIDALSNLIGTVAGIQQQQRDREETVRLREEELRQRTAGLEQQRRDREEQIRQFNEQQNLLREQNRLARERDFMKMVVSELPAGEAALALETMDDPMAKLLSQGLEEAGEREAEQKDWERLLQYTKLVGAQADYYPEAEEAYKAGLEAVRERIGLAPTIDIVDDVLGLGLGTADVEPPRLGFNIAGAITPLESLGAESLVSSARVKMPPDINKARFDLQNLLQEVEAVKSFEKLLMTTGPK